MSSIFVPLSIAALAAAVTAQSQPPSCFGNGAGQAYIQHTQARIGQSLRIDLGSPAAPGGIGVLSVSDGFGPVVFPSPVLGTICLDVFSSGYYTELVFLDGTGNATLNVPIPANPSLELSSAPLFLNGLAVEGTIANPVLATSNTVRLEWHNPDSWAPVNNTMQESRSLHTATSLHRFPGDTRTAVLITGGGGGNFMQPVATDTTEIYEPLTRTFTPGPALSIPRSGHRATMLQDGRVLITGGATTGAIGTATCEIYDPATNTFSPAAPMSTPRMGHRATLLSDGRVFVAGGFSTWQNAVTQFGVVLRSSQNTTDIYDPTTDTWTQGPVMAARRSGHGQLLTTSGEVLLFGGIAGGILTSQNGFPSSNYAPSYTNKTELFDPVNNTLTELNPMQIVRGFFGYSATPAGILVTGGFVPDPTTNAAVAGAVCELFDGTTWSNVGSLPAGQATNVQITSARSGNALTFGGFVGNLTTLASSASVYEHDGSATNAVARADVATNPALSTGTMQSVGYHTVTELYDGTFLLVGGQHILLATPGAWIYIEP